MHDCCLSRHAQFVAVGFIAGRELRRAGLPLTPPGIRSRRAAILPPVAIAQSQSPSSTQIAASPCVEPRLPRRQSIVRTKSRAAIHRTLEEHHNV